MPLEFLEDTGVCLSKKASLSFVSSLAPSVGACLPSEMGMENVLPGRMNETAGGQLPVPRRKVEHRRAITGYKLWTPA